MSYCSRDHPEAARYEDENQFLVCPENWERLKQEWNKAKEFLTTDRDIERFQSICRWVLLRRVDPAVGLDMAKKLKPELERIYPEFIYWLCACYYVDLSHYEEPGNARIQVRLAATNAIIALKALQFELDAPDHMAVATVPKYTDRVGNIFIKDLLENALKMYCKNTETFEEPTTLTARDFFDSFILCDNPDAICFKDSSFLKFKKTLVDIIDKNNSYASSSTPSVPSCIQQELNSVKKESIETSDDAVFEHLLAKYCKNLL